MNTIGSKATTRPLMTRFDTDQELKFVRIGEIRGCFPYAVAAIAFVCLGVFASLSRAEEPGSFRKIADVEFATVGKTKLQLDIYRPRKAERPPLVVWIHGGAWRRGSREKVPILSLVERGYAIASVDYRLSPVARFPAQIHDCKAAIRFLRANAKTYGYDATRIGVAGASAGGHLTALVGVTNGHAALEGDVGDHDDVSSDVHAIVDYYGPTNLTTILDQSTPHGLSVRVPALKLLFGGSPEEKPDLARLASPVMHVDAHDPPLLMIHGDQDPQVPINQSHELEGAYEAKNRVVRFEVVHGGVHGGTGFHDERRSTLVADFLDRHLKSSKETASKNREKR